MQLRIGKVLIANLVFHFGKLIVNCSRFVLENGVIGGALGGGWSAVANKGDDEDDAQLDDGENPEEYASRDGITRSAFQGMLYGERHAEISLHTDRREEERAVVDGHVENEPRQRAEGIGHVPDHAVHHLLHLEGQEEQEEQVRNGQVEKEDVDWRRLLPDLFAEGVEGQDVSGEAQHKGEHIDGQAQTGMALLHGGQVASSRVQEARRITSCLRYKGGWIVDAAGLL